MKTLVLAEKPSVGKDIARVLNCKSAGRSGHGGGGYMEGAQYVVTWALGHLVTLEDPEQYDPTYKNWDINHLPIMPDVLRLTVIPQTSKQYKTVKDLLLRKDIGSIVIATDAGREGELVARWIIEKAKCKKPIKRLWISSVTDKAIKDGFKNLKDGKLYQNLCDSAKARAEADWLVGINATRCLTTKFNSPLSCGRVQTPTLAIIFKREDEIRKFIPQPYYGISATADSFRITWLNGDSSRCFDKAKIDAVFSQLKSIKEGTVTDVVKTIKKKYPPKLYDLTELQRDANKRYGYSPKETLSIMQRLYEEHKVLTYPRTDSRYISTDIVPTIPERLKACSVPPYAKMCTQILRSPIRPNSNYVDNAKVSDHHAIIPTEHPVNLQSLNDRERKIFDLVLTRFLSVFYPPFEYEQVTVKIKVGNELFTANGRVVLSQGYQAVYQDMDEDEENADTHAQVLPGLKRGNRVSINNIKLTDGKTSPPSPFNEATLLSAMESPAKYMETKDRALADTLQKTGGLGTVATRADIIEKLFDNFLIEKRGKDIFSTSKGRQLLNLVPKDLKSPELTGLWEQKLLSISTGKMNKNEFLLDIRKYTAELITEIKSSTQVFRHDNLSTTKCPDCGKFMLQVTGKKGEMLVCQDRECNTRVNVSMAIRSKCPHCHKFLKIIGENEKRQIVCACGYREKYTSFEKRKKEERNSMSKKEVQAYLKNEEKNKEPNNNPFAALKGMKFD
ncbi:MAG: DNA topoisomerase III [Defluviitaleaceae bacterium]|nr:DNA topoisomerase III [Defluviitaleaceae bacterium]